MKIAILFAVLCLSACAPDAKDKANHDVKVVEQDVKRGVEKIKNAPATKELADDAKRGFHKADEAVTKSLEKGREKVREKVNGDPK